MPRARTGFKSQQTKEPVPPGRPDERPWPRISIVTPSYNQGQFIEETIRSAQQQDYSEWEMLVVDDCSPDPACKAYALERAAEFGAYGIDYRVIPGASHFFTDHLSTVVSHVEDYLDLALHQRPVALAMAS